MSIARRGIFGMLAALPFIGKRAVAARSPVSHVTMKLDFTAADLNEFRAECERQLDAAWGRVPTLSPGWRIVTIGAHVQDDCIESAPFGWDTLENVR